MRALASKRYRSAGATSLRLCAEDRIPERGTNTKTSVVVLEVVAHVKLTQLAAQPCAWLVMVHVEVQHVVDQVAGEESASENHPDSAWQRSVETHQEQRCQRNACRWGHYKPHWVIGMVVVDSVDHEVEPMSPRVVCIKVKDDSVQPILSQSPEQPSGSENASCRGDSGFCGSRNRQIADRRDKDDHRHRGVNSRKLVQGVGLKHPWRSLKDFVTWLLRLCGGFHQLFRLPVDSSAEWVLGT